MNEILDCKKLNTENTKYHIVNKIPYCKDPSVENHKILDYRWNTILQIANEMPNYKALNVEQMLKIKNIILWTKYHILEIQTLKTQNTRLRPDWRDSNTKQMLKQNTRFAERNNYRYKESKPQRYWKM